MMSCPFVHFSLPHHVHNTFLSTSSSLEMELTGIGSILEAMEGIDNSLSSVYVAILTLFISEEGKEMLVLVSLSFVGYSSV